MKKLFYFAAAAVALAACAKNEVIPVNSGENQEITFNVAPKTKADPEPKKEAFSTGNVFASWAYYLPKGTDWNDKSTNQDDPAYPKEYISGAKVSHDGTVWKAEKSYYWPKDGGKLTFFAYSLNKGDLKLDDSAASTLTCDPFQGIYAHINLSVDKNVDFLVADIKADQTANTTTTGSTGKYYNDGVPTLFRHRLSYVAFNVKTLKDYSTEGKRLDLKSISFKNISFYGEYRQVAVSESFPSGFKASTDDGHVGIVNYTKNSTEAPFAQEIISTNEVVSPFDNFLYIPQTFVKGSDDTKNAYIEVKYTITTTVPVTTHEGTSTKEVVEEVTKNIFLYPATGTTMFEKWEMGKKYTINLTFTLDEILWDPAVQDWEDVNIGADTAPIIVG